MIVLDTDALVRWVASTADFGNETAGLVDGVSTMDGVAVSAISIATALADYG